MSRYKDKETIDKHTQQILDALLDKRNFLVQQIMDLDEDSKALLERRFGKPTSLESLDSLKPTDYIKSTSSATPVKRGHTVGSGKKSITPSEAVKEVRPKQKRQDTPWTKWRRLEGLYKKNGNKVKLAEAQAELKKIEDAAKAEEKAADAAEANANRNQIHCGKSETEIVGGAGRL